MHLYREKNHDNNIIECVSNYSHVGQNKGCFTQNRHSQTVTGPRRLAPNRQIINQL